MNIDDLKPGDEIRIKDAVAPDRLALLITIVLPNKLIIRRRAYKQHKWGPLQSIPVSDVLRMEVQA